MSNRPPFKQAFTFDDVLLVPQKSSVLPRDVNIRTRLTNNIELNINNNSDNEVNSNNELVEENDEEVLEENNNEEVLEENDEEVVENDNDKPNTTFDRFNTFFGGGVRRQK